MAEICVIGVGYVGLVTGTCFADLGNDVICLDVDEAKIDKLRGGHLPIFEPGLEELLQRNAQAGRLRFTTDYAEALARAEFVFIAVGTPSGVDGEADLRHVRAAAERIAVLVHRPLILINKSTVPIGAGDWVTTIVQRSQPEPIPFAVVSNPEFLREGSAVHDFLAPDRIVLGSADPEAARRVAELYAPLKTPMVITDIRTAEMIKYASNSFLATKISFMNEIATICEPLGADVKMVARGMGHDRRIGPHYLDAGLGWGGSCFGKDVRALEFMAATHGCHPQLLRAVMEINRDQRHRLIQKLRGALGGSLDRMEIGVLGLSFKPNTDDMRDAPSLTVIHQLQREGARVRAYDPAAMPVAARLLHEVYLAANPYEAATGADAVVICTEWNEFKQLDLPRLRGLMLRPVVVDGRNMYEPERMRELGFVYHCVGRPQRDETPALETVATAGQLDGQ
ncbi:MAG: UDP-glucose/GDP-mannose dehydrogenase family protein [Chloroflexi bacterium]|nr:UDP-glucose/GDP-mannose dehydrogenase family protein [Chloroflexota bacterium]